MGKSLLFLAFICLVILIVGTATMSQTSAFWMASSLPVYQVIRLILSAILLTQFMTDPPRNRAFRVFAGLIAGSIAIWSLDSTYNNHMLLLDSFSLLSTACAIGITALEINPEDLAVPQRTVTATNLSPTR